jgi:RNA methyltransferase, TrmH family
MISKARLKWVKSLQLKKYRQEEQCFLVQGRKGVQELLRSAFEVLLVAGIDETINQLTVSQLKKVPERFAVSSSELEAMGSFQSNDSIIAVARMNKDAPARPATDGFTLVLDDIRDPGNLGTIIRTADWFGIKQIVASTHTAEFYNPKTISATMGSFCRVTVAYTSLTEFLTGCDVPVYGAFLSGRNIHHENFGKSGIVVIGNESSGISPAVEVMINNRISIPGSGGAESLNAAIATGIILDNIFRSK